MCFLLINYQKFLTDQSQGTSEMKSKLKEINILNKPEIGMLHLKINNCQRFLNNMLYMHC